MLGNVHFHGDGTVTRRREDGSHAVQLARPVKWGGRVTSEVVVRAPSARDAQRAATLTGPPAAIAASFAAMLTGLPRAVIDKLDAADYNKVAAAIDQACG